MTAPDNLEAVTALVAPFRLQAALIHIDMLGETLRRAEADNARLRALVKYAEHCRGYDGVCPWGECSAPGHRDGCPAFTPDGTVK